MTGYAHPGCPADDVVHGCAGELCQVGWLHAEKALPSVHVDLRPAASLIHAAAFGLGKGLYLGGQRGMTQDQDNPHAILEDCIKGKAAEAAYALHAGIDPAVIVNDARSRADFRRNAGNVDVKYAKRVGGLMRCTLAKGTWDRIKRDPTYRLVAISIDGWSAQLLGEVTAVDLDKAMHARQVPCLPPKGRDDGGWWYEIRVGLMRPVTGT